MTPSVRTVRGPLVIAAVVVLVDQLTKHWALRVLGDGHVVHVVGSLQLNLAFNSGMAFSRGDGLGPFVPVLAVGVIAALLIALGRSDSPWFAVGVGLVIGGSIGNVLDRLFRGEGWLRGQVVDFIDLQWWPIFNVADMAITIGGVLLVLGTVFAGSSDTAPSETAPSGSVPSGSGASGSGPSGSGPTDPVS
ncbi:MAG: signal peptidase II [Ilumatobacteraceae bacterium]